MKIGIVGSGAIGSVYGAILADAGHELWMFDQRRDHVDAMCSKGLRCTGASGDRRVGVNATTDAAAAGPCEWSRPKSWTSRRACARRHA